jgi:hypothetical protein
MYYSSRKLRSCRISKTEKLSRLKTRDITKKFREILFRILDQNLKKKKKKNPALRAYATWEAEIRRTAVQDTLSQKYLKHTHTHTHTHTQIRAGGVTHYLPPKSKVLSSKPSTAEKEKKIH